MPMKELGSSGRLIAADLTEGQLRMPHPCVSFMASRNGSAFVYQSGLASNNLDALTPSTSMITMPLCKIAEKLGIDGIPAGHLIPEGIWISDGSGGMAYNYMELIDKMTERMSHHKSSGL